jgi:hypothetical protein
VLSTSLRFVQVNYLAQITIRQRLSQVRLANSFCFVWILIFASASSRLNDDVLDCILSMSLLEDSARAGRVCSAWLDSSRRRLYTNLVFASSSGDVLLLAVTLTNSPHIRNMIRDLKLICRPYHNDRVSLYDWLSHLSPAGLRAISIDQIGPNAEFTAVVMTCPALRGFDGSNCRVISFPWGV